MRPSLASTSLLRHTALAMTASSGQQDKQQQHHVKQNTNHGKPESSIYISAIPPCATRNRDSSSSMPPIPDTVSLPNMTGLSIKQYIEDAFKGLSSEQQTKFLDEVVAKMRSKRK